MRIRNDTRGNQLAESVQQANTFASRLRGWLGKTRAVPGQGFYLTPCSWVHTFGMRMNIDAVYINRTGVVMAVRTLPPNRLGPWVPDAVGVLELAAGTCERLGCRVGDRLELDGEQGG